MDQLTCQRIINYLVDYADNQLDNKIVSEVDSHLIECPHCKNTLQSLQKSLSLTQVIWEDNLTSVCGKSNPTGIKSFLRKRLKPIAVAACLLIVAGVYLSFMIPDKELPELTFEQIEQQIQQNAAAARLLVAADMLAELPDTESIVRTQYNYILQTYPDSSAAAQVRSKINNL